MKPISDILAVDDNADDLFLLRQAFRKAGVPTRLHAATDGVEAQAYLEGRDNFADRSATPFPDLILLDLNMPRMNGFEFLDWVRHDPRFAGMVVHVLTASPRDADAQRAYALHANSYVIKPTRLDELVSMVKAMHAWHAFACTAPQSDERIAALGHE